ncbi:hypothetical protein D3C81_682530 [compost metagenome]
MVARQVKRFLRRTGALDRHRRLGEQGTALLELLHQLPGVRGQVVAVVGGHAVAAQGLAQAIDSLPVEFQAWANHQLLVADGAATFEDNELAQGVEALHPRLDPLHAPGNGRGHGARRARRLEHTCADHGPAGLVVMHFGRVDQRNIQRWITADQAGRRGDTGGAGTDDDHFVVVAIGSVGRGQQGRHGGISWKSRYGKSDHNLFSGIFR